jgi:hypothetical protein
MIWGKLKAPPGFREKYYDASPLYYWEAVKSTGREALRGWQRTAAVVRGVHASRGRQ